MLLTCDKPVLVLAKVYEIFRQNMPNANLYVFVRLQIEVSSPGQTFGLRVFKVNQLGPMDCKNMLVVTIKKKLT